MTSDSEKPRKIEVQGRSFNWSLNHQYGNCWRDNEPPAVGIVSDDHQLEFLQWRSPCGIWKQRNIALSLCSRFVDVSRAHVTQAQNRLEIGP